MILAMKGDQLGLDEDHMFDEFEVEIDDDLAEDDVIDIIQVTENDCDVSHMIDEKVAKSHIRSMLAVVRDVALLDRQSKRMEIDI